SPSPRRHSVPATADGVVSPLASLAGVDNPAQEQNAAAALVTESKQERMIRPENNGLQNRRSFECRTSGRSSFGPLFINIDEGLMHDGGNVRSAFPEHARKIFRTEGIHHPHGLQLLVQ